MSSISERMLGLPFASFFLTFTVVYGGACYYLYRRGLNALRAAGCTRIQFYRICLLLIMAAYPLGRGGAAFLPKTLADILILIGSYWLGLLYYLFWLAVLADLLRLANRFLHFVPRPLAANPARVTAIIALTALAVAVGGAWNAAHPVIRHYDIKFDKQLASDQPLKIAAVSDIHLGKIIGIGRLNQLVMDINSLHPDIVLLAGDIIDESVDYFAEQNMPDILQHLNAPLGVYAVLGNHEYIGRNPDGAVAYLTASHIRVLRDEYITLPNGVIIAGRDDRSRDRYYGEARKELSNILTGADLRRPIILLDHQPFRLDEPQSAGVDLQISGHTHNGQLFPNNLITKRMYEDSWGFLRKGSLQVIVSCGYGTWGPPMRLGNTPEILEIIATGTNE